MIAEYLNYVFFTRTLEMGHFLVLQQGAISPKVNQNLLQA